MFLLKIQQGVDSCIHYIAPQAVLGMMNVY